MREFTNSVSKCNKSYSLYLLQRQSRSTMGLAGFMHVDCQFHKRKIWKETRVNESHNHDWLRTTGNGDIFRANKTRLVLHLVCLWELLSWKELSFPSGLQYSCQLKITQWKELENIYTPKTQTKTLASLDDQSGFQHLRFLNHISRVRSLHNIHNIYSEHKKLHEGLQMEISSRL